MISYGGSNNNISILVDTKDKISTLQFLNKKFGNKKFVRLGPEKEMITFSVPYIGFYDKEFRRKVRYLEKINNIMKISIAYKQTNKLSRYLTHKEKSPQDD